jgi:hypothetical protein
MSSSGQWHFLHPNPRAEDDGLLPNALASTCLLHLPRAWRKREEAEGVAARSHRSLRATGLDKDESEAEIRRLPGAAMAARRAAAPSNRASVSPRGRVAAPPGQRGRVEAPSRAASLLPRARAAAPSLHRRLLALGPPRVAPPPPP